MKPENCRRPYTYPMSKRVSSCLERLAEGWLGAPDLCPSCTQVFMNGLDSVAGPLRWHKSFVARSQA